MDETACKIKRTFLLSLMESLPPMVAYLSLKGIHI
jgi:hypothetical protein